MNARKAPRTAVIYARISRAERDENGELLTDGVDRQIERLRTLASDRGLDVVREIVENDTSASRGTRAGFIELQRLMRDGKVKVIVAFGLDRLARRRRDLAELLDEASRQGVDLVLLNGADIAASTPAGRMVASMMGAVATAEVETMSLRLSEGYRQRANRGSHVPRQRTFGYKTGNLKAEPKEAKIVREIVAAIADGESIAALARAFKERGVVSTKGKPLSRQAILKIARNPRYVGICEHRQVIRDGDGKETRRELVSTTDGDWDALVDRSTWDAAQAVLSHPDRHRERTTTKYLLSGIATCEVCSTALQAGAGTGGRRLYVCPNVDCRAVGRTAGNIDAAIEPLVLATLTASAPDVLRGAESGDPLTEAAALEDRRKQLAAMFAEGSLDAAAYSAATTALAAKLDEIQSRAISVTSHPLADLPLGKGDQKIAAAWADADVLTKRRILRHLFTVSITPIGKGRPRHPLEGVTVERVTPTR